MTGPQLQMLENIRAGRNPGDGFASGKYAGRPAGSVCAALLRRGWIEPTGLDVGPAYRITDAGEAARAAAAAALPPRPALLCSAVDRPDGTSYMQSRKLDRPVDGRRCEKAATGWAVCDEHRAKLMPTEHRKFLLETPEEVAEAERRGDPVARVPRG